MDRNPKKKIYMTVNKCKSLLKDKISINTLEYKKGRYANRNQAIAVAYSMINRKFPSCKKHLVKSKMRFGGCDKSHLKKYLSRPGPPYPAQECKDMIKTGNDGRLYVSKLCNNGVYKWMVQKSSDEDGKMNAKPNSRSRKVRRRSGKPKSRSRKIRRRSGKPKSRSRE